MKSLMKILVLLLIVCSCSNQPNQGAVAISPRFNHVMLYVSDLEESIQFYASAFDLHVTNRLDQLSFLQEDGIKSNIDVKMAFLKFPGQDFVFELSEQSSIPDSTVNATFQHLGIDVENIELSLQRAVDAGGELVVGIRLVEGNGIAVKNAFLKGPDGEFVELMQMISGEF